MQLLYDNAIYFLLHKWINEYVNFEEEKMRKARKILQEKYAYRE